MLCDALKPHRSTLTPKLWAVLESAKPGDAGLLPSAGTLASYAPDDTRWEAVGGKVAQALVSVDAILLGSWIEALRPVRSKLSGPLATIFQDKDHSESERKLATNILANYASDDPDRLAELLMVADPKAYRSLFPVAEKRAEQVLPVLQAELARKATYSWNDSPVDPTWIMPDATLTTGSSRPRECSPSDSPSARQCRLTTSSRPPKPSANRVTAPCGSAPMLMGRWCGSRRSWPETDETGGTPWLHCRRGPIRG